MALQFSVANWFLKLEEVLCVGLCMKFVKIALSKAKWGKQLAVI